MIITQTSYLRANNMEEGITLEEMREFLTECDRLNVPGSATLRSAGFASRLTSVRAVYPKTPAAETEEDDTDDQE